MRAEKSIARTWAPWYWRRCVKDSKARSAKGARGLLGQLETEFELVREALKLEQKETEVRTLSSPHFSGKPESQPRGLDL